MTMAKAKKALSGGLLGQVAIELRNAERGAVVSDKVVAAHEAGHAVAQWVLYETVTAIEVFGRDGRIVDGNLALGINEASGKLVDPHREVLRALAGYAVESICYRENWRYKAGLFFCRTTDHDDARELLSRHECFRVRAAKNKTGSKVMNVEEALDHNFRRAEKLMLENLDAVEAVAKKLLQKRRLSGRQVSGILSKFERRWPVGGW